MKTKLLEKSELFLKLTMLLIASASVLSFIIVAIIRINYPYELEWIEEGILAHVMRVIQGQPIYVHPTLEYVPFIYPPLFYYLSAFLANIIGAGYAPLRIISFLSSLGIAAIVFLFVKRETKDLLSSFIASSFFISCYSAVLFWYDIGRVDVLTLFLFFSFLYLIRFYSSYIIYMVAGILITLSFLSKQEGLPLSIPIIIYLYFIDWRKAIVLTVSLILSLMFAVILLDYINNSIFSYYTISLPLKILKNSIQPTRLISIWTKDLIKPIPILISLYIYFLLFAKKYLTDKRYTFYIVISICIILGCLPYRTIRYGNSNALMPAFIILAIVSGIAFFLIKTQLETSSLDIKNKLKIMFYFVVIIHFILLIYTPVEVLPTETQRANEEKLIAEISKIKGEVFIPSHSYLATFAGKRESAHISGLDDLLSSDDSMYRNYLFNDLMNALKEQRYGAIVTDQFWFTNGGEIMKQMSKYYEVERDEDGMVKTYRLSNQDFSRPTIIFIPRNTPSNDSPAP